MKQIITDDGSVTFYNEAAGDHYHTKSGAKEEAIEKHVKALGLKSGKVIFDICFGLGYNTAAALDVGPATVYCFENDKEILKKILEIDAPFRSFSIIKEFIRGFFDGNPVYKKDNTRLIMLFGDVRKTIKEQNVNADYIFFDPFSPAKVPELWTEELFKDIYIRSNKNAKLSTYSCARFVRENMKAAGFYVKNGPVIGRRSPSTIAIRE